jgi:hypothetical protein
MHVSAGILGVHACRGVVFDPLSMSMVAPPQRHRGR